MNRAAFVAVLSVLLLAGCRQKMAVQPDASGAVVVPGSCNSSQRNACSSGAPFWMCRRTRRPSRMAEASRARRTASNSGAPGSPSTIRDSAAPYRAGSSAAALSAAWSMLIGSRSISSVSRSCSGSM